VEDQLPIFKVHASSLGCSFTSSLYIDIDNQIMFILSCIVINKLEGITMATTWCSGDYRCAIWHW